MQQRGSQTGFPPVYSSDSRALILGSYPSPKSFAYGFYYGHPQNRFWPLLSALTGRALPQSIEEKRQLILESGLALWDSLARCRITGAADASIREAQPNDIAFLLDKTKITAVFCNGSASYQFYKQHCQAQTGIEAVRLPSTSPANAAFSLPKLIACWQPLVAYISKC